MVQEEGQCNLLEEYDIEEEEDVEEHEVDVLSYEEVKEVDLIVDDNVLDDDIDNNIIENDIDDDVDMANPSNVDYEPYDTYVDLDVEDDDE
jgi:hypothetical protein